MRCANVRAHEYMNFPPTRGVIQISCLLIIVLQEFVQKARFVTCTWPVARGSNLSFSFFSLLFLFLCVCFFFFALLVFEIHIGHIVPGYLDGLPGVCSHLPCGPRHSGPVQLLPLPSARFWQHAFSEKIQRHRAALAAVVSIEMEKTGFKFAGVIVEGAGAAALGGLARSLEVCR